MGAVTTNYTLDLNTGLTQVLTDGTATYLYGLGRIGEYDSANWTYPLADALGSVRQLTDSTGAPVMAQNYAPYGDVLGSYGAQTSNYGFAGEWTDGTGLQHLRARYLNTGIGRFISRDTWGGDGEKPISMNRWVYANANPLIYLDPTGNIACRDTKDPECEYRAKRLRGYGLAIKESVYLGSMLPVEGLALLVDYAFPLFDDDYRGAMWAITLTITGFDANRGMIGRQAPLKQHNDDYWFNYDWLPYKNNWIYNVDDWGLKGERWIHSLRGDWDTDYWDKTANQAYHFWFYVAVAFFDGPGWARAGNRQHEGLPGDLEDITTLNLGVNEAPPSAGKTLQDENLSQQAITLGGILSTDRYYDI